MRQDSVYDPGVFPNLVPNAREHSDVNAIRRLDAFEGRAEGLLDPAVWDSPRGQNLKSKARLWRLPHDFIHARRIALEIDVAGHFHHLAVEHPPPFVRRARAVVDAASVEVDVPALFL